MRGKELFWTLSVIVLVVLALQFFLPPTESPTAQASGTFSICINQPPVLNYSGCNLTLLQNSYYVCNLSAFDADMSDSFTYSAYNTSGNLYFNRTSGLLIAQPNQSFVGNTSYDLLVQDTSGCSNNADVEHVIFEVIDVNDPPVFIPPVGPFEWNLGEQLRGIFLNNYFYDIDGDALTFSSSTPSSNFQISIVGDELLLTANACGDSSIIITAQDPGGLTGDSDIIEISAPCVPETTSSSGGGGGGGRDCNPTWDCSDWGACLVNGTQKKTCVDITGCEKEGLTYWRDCIYIPHCTNGVLDADELGVDCGGSCPVCMTCFDGVQNQGELGVDCGGPCPACTLLQTPTPINQEKNPLLWWFIATLALSAVLAVVYTTFKKQIHQFLAKLLFYFSRAHRKNILLTEAQRDLLLEELADLESKQFLLSKEKTNLTKHQDSLVVIFQKLYVMLLGPIFDPVEIENAIKHKRHIPNLLKHLLHKQYVQERMLEQADTLPALALELHTELLRQRIYSLSNVSKELLSREVQVKEVRGQSLETGYSLLYNAVLALQFRKIAQAQTNYLQALKVYDVLPAPEQSELFGVLHLVFDDIRYTKSYK